MGDERPRAAELTGELAGELTDAVADDAVVSCRDVPGATVLAVLARSPSPAPDVPRRLDRS